MDPIKGELPHLCVKSKQHVVTRHDITRSDFDMRNSHVSWYLNRDRVFVGAQDTLKHC
ncbi:MAG: hypothetical protein ACWA47_08545 [Brevirhabdus sp.]